MVGVSKSGYGTSGDSDSSAGVVGISTQFNAVRGISHAAGHGAIVGINDNDTNNAGPGVYGESKAVGVWGVSNTWHGVASESQTTTGGAGVYGKGVRARYFEGNVDIMGNLTIQGVSIQLWLQRIIHLEQEIAVLKQRVATLHPGSSIPDSGTSIQPVINLSIEFGPGGIENHVLRHGFTAGEQVKLQSQRKSTTTIRQREPRKLLQITMGLSITKRACSTL